MKKIDLQKELKDLSEKHSALTVWYHAMRILFPEMKGGK